MSRHSCFIRQPVCEETGTNAIEKMMEQAEEAQPEGARPKVVEPEVGLPEEADTVEAQREEAQQELAEPGEVPSEEAQPEETQTEEARLETAASMPFLDTIPRAAGSLGPSCHLECPTFFPSD